MKDNLAAFLWRRRMYVRLKTMRDVLSLVVDFWTALYIVVPLLILIVDIYRKLLVALPAWIAPNWEAVLVSALAYFLVRGNQRSYLDESDLTFIYPNSKVFHQLFRVGMGTSLGINNIGILLLVAGLFPFYLHLEAVSIHIWLGIGLWIIILRIAFLLILFWLQGTVSRFLSRMLFFTGFIAIWNQVVMPYIHTGNTSYWALMLGIALFMLAGALLLYYILPINNWEKIVQDEANYNIRIMGQILGFAGKPVRKRNGISLWSLRRLGIPFRKTYSVTYFYIKYFLRLKIVWQISMEISAVCFLVVVSSVSYWAILGFIAIANLMLGLFVRSIVVENTEKLNQFTQALNINDRKKGLINLFIIMMVPLSFFPVFSFLAGTMNSIEAIGGIIVLLAWALISSKILLNFSNIKQYLTSR